MAGIVFGEGTSVHGEGCEGEDCLFMVMCKGRLVDEQYTIMSKASLSAPPILPTVSPSLPPIPLAI